MSKKPVKKTIQKTCSECNKSFWTIDPNATTCARKLCRHAQAVVELNARGLATGAIAVELGVNHNLVFAIIRRKKLRQAKELRSYPGIERSFKTDPRAAEMLQLKRSGMTLARIGEQFSLSRERVRQILWDVGCHTRIDEEHAKQARVRELHTRGLTTREIASELGCSINVILRLTKCCHLIPLVRSRAKVPISIIIDTYQQTKSTIETAAILGIAQGNVWRRLKNAGIQMVGKKGSPEAEYLTSEGLLTVKEIAQHAGLTLKGAQNRIYNQQWDESRLLEPNHAKHEKRGGRGNAGQQ